MKKFTRKKISFFLFVNCLLLTANSFAQAPQKMSYQAVIRNAGNVLLSNSTVGMQISVLQGSASGTPVYVETQTATTNINGLVSLQIGNGTPVTGTFSAIDWTAGPYFVKTETDIAGGTNYTIAGTTELLSVPYALFSASGGSPSPDNQTLNISNDSLSISNGNKVNLSAYLDNTDNQNLSLSNDSISISGGNKIDLSSFKDNTDSQSLSISNDTLNISGGNKVALDAYKDNTDAQTLSISNDTISITGGNYIKLPAAATGNAATYRWATFHTYDQSGWSFNNDASFFGGVSPSSWTDGNAVASQISPNKDIQRTLFQRKGYAKENAMIICDNYVSYSSTNGEVCVVLFRIKNNTGSAINWNPFFYYTAYLGWSEMASITVNGANTWSSGTSGNTSVTLAIPTGQVSTVIFVSTSGVPVAGSVRPCRLAFYNNSLVLPAGLEFVDDLDTATGNWNQ